MNIKLSQSFGGMGLAVTGLAQPVAAETLGEHPAVSVQRSWSTRGIDPNTFIVAHPARLALLAASPSTQMHANGEHASAFADSTVERGDAHSQAAALLSGVRFSQARDSSAPRPLSREIAMDAHEQAAALLGGLRVSSDPQLRAARTQSVVSTGWQAR
jgi:outer membrane PBP1 activator LpoA protein